jgi:hypothetical protein
MGNSVTADTARMSKKKPGSRKAPGKSAKAEPARDSVKPSFDDRTFLKSLGTGRSSATFQPKAVVYRQGDPADAVYNIEAGKIQLTVSPFECHLLPLWQDRQSFGSKRPR